MALDKALTRQKLTTLWEDGKVKVFETVGKKYAIISDTHLGDGGEADDFRDNAETLQTALEHYRAHKYALILLGDIEEFWQFDLEKITARYGNPIYEKLRAFGSDRVHRIFGNHDREWGGFPDPVKSGPAQSAGAAEAIKMKDAHGATRILIVHGHQGSIDADKGSWFSRFFVRIFKSFEGLAKWAHLYGHSSATKSQVTKDFEQTLYGWAKENRVLLICGHSHRAIFASKSYAEKLKDEIGKLQADNLANRDDQEKVKRNIKEIQKLLQKLLDEQQKEREIDPTEPDAEPVPCYFNSGCALYSDGITTIEIDNDEIRLVKWNRDTGKVPRHEIFDKGGLTEFLQKIDAV